MASPPVTGSMLYDLVACPHRVTMDLFADPKDRDAVSPFVQLLWERGAAHEKQIVAEIREPFTDLSGYTGTEKERLTLEAMGRGHSLIYAGRIALGDLLGEPDLLRKEGNEYIAGDIKSGAGEESAGDDGEGKPKKHYAVQLALYTDILEQLGRSAGRRAFVWDIHRDEVPYDFMAPYGTRNSRRLWDDYQECLAEAREIVSHRLETLPAYASGTCKNCVWYTACIDTLEKANDLTLIPELGRSKREVMVKQIGSISDFASIDISRFISGQKTAFLGIGSETLKKLQARAKLLSDNDGKPYLRGAVAIPTPETELFFDIEVDPMRDVCYLHGFVERRGGANDTERYVPFFANAPTPVAEQRAFAEAWEYIQSMQPCMIYYYSKYERTIYRKLREKYPNVCSADDIEVMFDPARSLDLYYDVVLKATEWPTRDYSIKTIAKHLGFAWRDAHPSGAASIEWFHRWVESSDSAIRQRILDYNEDDCRATRVLLDAVRQLPLKT